VAERLAHSRISALPVLDMRERPVGVVSRFDLLRVGRLRARTARGDALLDLPDVPVRKVMHPRVIAVGLDATMTEVGRTMLEHHVHRVLVIEDGRLVGIVTTTDAMRAVAAARMGAPLSHHGSAPVITVSTTDPISLATDRLSSAHVAGVVVLEEGRAVGLFGQMEALEAHGLPVDTAVEEVMGHGLVCLPADAPLHRAASIAAETRAHRVLAFEGHRLVGISTGLDFAAALVEHDGVLRLGVVSAQGETARRNE
jgi:CBS domain-containing protein